MEKYLTEKEKMLAGKLYDAFYDKELADDRVKAKTLCHRYNMLSPEQMIIFVLLAHFGVIMGIILRLEKIFTPIMIV